MVHKRNVLQYTFTGLPNQEFKFIPVEGERGKYRLQVRHRSLYLGMDTYKSVMQFPKGNSWQIWEIIVTDDFTEDGRPATEIQDVITPDLTTKSQSNQVTRYTIG